MKRGVTIAQELGTGRALIKALQDLSMHVGAAGGGVLAKRSVCLGVSLPGAQGPQRSENIQRPQADPRAAGRALGRVRKVLTAQRPRAVRIWSGGL